jgi:hypothetical protein
VDVFVSLSVGESSFGSLTILCGSCLTFPPSTYVMDGISNIGQIAPPYYSHAYAIVSKNVEHVLLGHGLSDGLFHWIT